MVVACKDEYTKNAFISDMFLQQRRRKLDDLASITMGHYLADCPAIVVQIPICGYPEIKTVAFHFPNSANE